MPRCVKVRFSHTERDGVRHLLHQIKKLPDARRFDLDHFIRKRVSHNVTFILLLSPFSIRIIPWSLYFFRTKCVAVPDTASSVESFVDTNIETSFNVFPSRKTTKSKAPDIR